MYYTVQNIIIYAIHILSCIHLYRRCTYDIVQKPLLQQNLISRSWSYFLILFEHKHEYIKHVFTVTASKILPFVCGILTYRIIMTTHYLLMRYCRYNIAHSRLLYSLGENAAPKHTVRVHSTLDNNIQSNFEKINKIF